MGSNTNINTWKDVLSYYETNITDEIAMHVRELDEEGYSWRMISALVDEKFPGFVLHPGNQVDGMYMCEIAKNR